MPHYVGILEGEGRDWSIRVPDLKGCHGAGDSVEDAIANTIDAMRDWAETVLGDGQKLPKARNVVVVLKDKDAEFAPERGESFVMLPLLVDQGRAVRANLSIDAGMLEAIDLEASRRGLTRSAFLVSAAREKITAGR